MFVMADPTVAVVGNVTTITATITVGDATAYMRWEITSNAAAGPNALSGPSGTLYSGAGPVYWPCDVLGLPAISCG